MRLCFKKSKLIKHKFGQYVFLNFPQVSLLQWHPFTLTSSPMDEHCEVLIKNLGDHTEKLIRKAVSTQSLYVRVDGPYGKWNFDPLNADHLILVAGGIGVTPFIGLLRNIYGADNSSAPHYSRLKSVSLVWACRDVEECCWFNDLFDHIACLDSVQYPRFVGHAFITGGVHPEKQPFVCLKTDFVRLNVADYFEEWEAKLNFDGESRFKACVVACGPSQLVNETWDVSIHRTCKEREFDFHFETVSNFSLPNICLTAFLQFEF
jgi:ferredoxin-NADP reductase